MTTTLTGTFTATNDASGVIYLRPNEVVRYTLTLTGTATVELQAADGQPANAWRILASATATTAATDYRNVGPSPIYVRLAAKAVGSGSSVAWTLQDVVGEQILQELRAANGDLAFIVTDAGPFGASSVFNVKDPRFGAVGDGVTDDTAAIQAAIDAASDAGGGVVFAPEGTYLCNTLLVPANVTLGGAGPGVTTFQKTGSESGLLIFFVRLMGNRAQLRDCTVIGGGATGTFGINVAITNSAKYCRVSNVDSYNCHIPFLSGGLTGDVSRSWDDCSYNVVENSTFHDCSDTCTSFFAPVSSIGNRLVNCDMWDSSGGSGNEMRNQIDGVYLNCTADTMQTGFRFEEACVGCVAIGCSTTNCTGRGFHAIGAVSTTGAVGQTRDCAFIGCVSDGDDDGFEVANSDRIKMVGCTAMNATSFGFIINGQGSIPATCEDFIIEGCTARACGVDGFRVQNGYGARGRINGHALNNTAAGVRIASGAGANGVVDVTSTGNATDFNIETASWAVRVAQQTVTLLDGPAATVQPNAALGNFFRIRVTDTNAFTISNPSMSHAAGLITLSIENASGGAMGAITFSAGYKLAGAFTNPATGNLREITFRRDTAGSVWREVGRTAADQLV